MGKFGFLCFTIILISIGIFDAILADGIPHHVYHRLRIHNKPLRKHRAVSHDGALHFDPEPFSSKKLELNSSGKIHCRVSGGTPPIVVEWFLNDSDPLPDGMTSSGGTLIVSEAAQRHRGKYTCRATDKHSTITFKVTVDVVVKPRILEPANGARVHVTEGTDVFLQCIAEGEPPPAITWDRNITILTRQVADVAMEGDDDADIASTVVFQNGTLLLRNVTTDNADKYGCTAGSSAGLQRADLFLYVHKEGELYDDSTGIGSKAVVISISVAGAYMLLVIALMVYCRNRRHRNREDKLELEMAEGGEKLVDDGDATDEKQKLTNNGLRNGRTLHEKDSGADNSESAVSRGSKKSQYDHLSVPRSMLTDLIVLGRGEFGEVSLGKVDMLQVRRLRKRSRDNKDTPANVDLRPVLVKALTTRDESQLAEFRRQIELFSKVRHENIVRLIGLVNDSEPHCLLLESTDWGDLKRFLISTRTQAEHDAYIQRVGSAHIEQAPIGSAAPLGPGHCIGLVGHLAAAATALAPNHTIRDIATRNCVITSKLQLKVTLPALSRGPYSHEYFKLHDRVIPLRWLPLEVVNEGDYSTKSDVYMFAATVWEIYTKAEMPFAKLNDNSVLEKLRSGSLEWTVPGSVPDRLAVLLKQCWDKSPKNRPYFDAIKEEVKSIIKEINEQNLTKSQENIHE